MAAFGPDSVEWQQLQGSNDRLAARQSTAQDKRYELRTQPRSLCKGECETRRVSESRPSVPMTAWRLSSPNELRTRAQTNATLLWQTKTKLANGAALNASVDVCARTNGSVLCQRNKQKTNRRESARKTVKASERIPDKCVTLVVESKTPGVPRRTECVHSWFGSLGALCSRRAANRRWHADS